jgi:hypothetical protein
VGNYGGNKKKWIQVSDVKNSSYELAIAIHELIEQHLIELDKIPLKAIDKFDIEFEKEFQKGLHSPDDEPGDDPRAPYFWHHQYAGIIERLFIQGCGLRWKDYEDAITKLWRPKKNIPNKS